MTLFSRFSPQIRLLTPCIIVALLMASCADDLEPSLLIEESDVVGDACDSSGTTVRIGFDTDHSGTLSDDQIQEVFHVCDGTQPDTAAKGTSGDDSPISRVEVHNEPPGSNCELGGKRIVSGVDEDESGTFSPGEINSVQYLCNKSCLQASPLLFDFDPADIPPAFYDGYSYTIDVETDADELAISAVSANSLNAVDVLPVLHPEYNADDRELQLTLENGVPDMEFLLFVTDGCKTTVASVPVADTTDEDSAEVYFISLISSFDLFDLKFTLTDETVATVPPFSPIDPVVLESGDYTFDLFEDNFLGTLPQFSVEPGMAYQIYLFEDGGEYDFGHERVPLIDTIAGQAHLRAHHAADDIGELEFMVVSAANSHSPGPALAFGEVTAMEALDFHPSAHLELELLDDQETLVYSETSGTFSEGAVVDILAARIADTVAIYLIDHNTGDWEYHIPDDVGESIGLSSQPNLAIPDDQTEGVTDTITVHECEVVIAIDIDIEITHSASSDLVVTLSSPDGSHHNLWYRTDDGANLTGNFNDTFWPPSGFFATLAQPMHVFLGNNGSGDWSLRVSDRLSGDTGTFHQWQLNLTCF